MSAPSGYTALDFVGFTDKGTYSPIVKYMRNDLVHHGGNIMRCKVDDTLNVTPVEGANWELWIGASANLAERTIAPLENNPADVAFGVGRQIIYDDWLWEVIAPIAVGDALIDYAVDPTNANIKKSAPVETQLLAVKAEADATDNMIAPTEANVSSSSAPYSVGDQLILNNILYDVIAAIQIGDALTTGTGGNIKAADTLTEQLAAKANSSDLAAVAGAVASELATIDSSIQTLEDNDDAMLNVLGAKNLLPNRLVSRTAHGVTYTKREDGSVVLNGTLNAVDTQTFSNGYNDKNIEWLKPLEGKEVILSGGVEHVSLTLAFYDANNTLFAMYATSYQGESVRFTVPSGISSYTGYTYTDSSTATFNNAVLKPMLRLASVSDDTYVPYAMTNQELSKRKILASETANANSGQWFAVEQFGEMVLVTLSAMTIALSTYPNGVIATGLPKPKYNTFAFAVSANGTAYRLRIDTDGKLTLLKESAATLTGDASYVTGQLIYFIAT